MNELFRYIAPGRRSGGPAGDAAAPTVGIPRAMQYLEHGKLWENFFAALGCGVIVSPQTNREILDRGIEASRNETCLPVKAFIGHVSVLADQVRAVFVPRYVSTARGEFSCPILCGLPDLARLAFGGRVEILEVTLDYEKGERETARSLDGIAARLGLAPRAVADAYRRAVYARLHTRMELGAIEPDPARPCIAVLGHPYMIYDPYLSMDLIKKLRRAGYRVVTPANLDYGIKRRNARPFDGSYFYEVGYENLGSAYTLERWPTVRGVVYLTPFGCGVDSLITEFIGRHFRDEKEPPPFLQVSVDEHSGDAGFDTRLEAFLDLAARRGAARAEGEGKTL